MHGAAIPDPYLAGDLIGFTAGLAITILLLALTLRAARLPGTPTANILLALCSLLWNAAGLAHALLLAAGVPRDSRLALATVAAQFSAAGAWPVPWFAIWRPYAVQQWQKAALRFLEVWAWLAAAGVAVCLWSEPVAGITLVPSILAKEFTAYSAALLLTAGVPILMRGRLTPRAVRLASFTILPGVLSAVVIILVLNNLRLSGEVAAILLVVSQQSILLVVLGAFFLFARFRFADLFIRYSVRIVLAALCAVILAAVVESPLLGTFAKRPPFPQAVRIFSLALLCAALVLLFPAADRLLNAFINRRVFRTPDYRAASQRLAETIRRLYIENEIAAALENAARETLEIAGARLIAYSKLPAWQWPPGLAEGQIVELELEHQVLPHAEVLVPLISHGGVSHVLAIDPGPERAGFVTRELDYLRAIAALCGSRFDALQQEREMVERRSREALLLQQVTEAELRALRAQINPHFLFNSLNSLANLIATDPARAETMTLRLAKVFRHVLAHSSRPFTSIRDEIEFLRTYLYIEEARFGDRLQVAIDVAPEAALEPIPSLILQPIVENALKHGLGPKPGPGHLWISASTRGAEVCLKVEDDGLGPAKGASSGVGLANVAQRLSTLYRDAAGVLFEPREEGGSRVTVRIPRGMEASAS